MSSPYHTILAAVALTCVPTLYAQNPPAPPQPGPAQAKLAFFAGRWTSDAEMKPGPMGPGGKMTGTDTCEWFAGGFHVVCRGEGHSPMGDMKNLGILGYDSERQRYTYYGIDNSGMGSGDMAYGQVSGDTWNWEGESMMGGKPVKFRYTVKQLSPDSYSFQLDMSMDGGPWATSMMGTETRVKP
jgi:hypothetical protein